MEQKFVKFEEALEKLGISAERLHQLRESGELRAYRDGSSWKFRGDEIERMASDGIPEPSPPSDIGLVDSDELVAAEPLKADDGLDDDLRLADDDQPASDLKLDTGDIGLADDMDDTVTAETSDVLLAPDEPSAGSDSILLSEEELGESVGPPASTIIGKEELAAEEADLQLAGDDDKGEGSELKLDSEASDVLSSGIAGSGVLDELESGSDGLSAFENLEELEIDLEAESSRILNPEEAAEVRAQAAAAEPSPLEGESDLQLADADDEGTDPVPAELELAGDDEGTDPAPSELELELETDQPAPKGDSDIDLDTGGEDFVLSDGSGSDITLGSGDSGINLVSPSDSGLALDDIPLEMGGSAILSSLSLGGSDPDISLVADDASPPAAKQEVAEEEDFQLTPLADVADDEEGDSSSQVIALDAGVEDLAAGEGGLLEADAFAEDGAEAVMLTEDEDIDAGGLGMAEYGGAPVAASTEADYTIWNVLSLLGCALLSLIAVMMLTDMIRSIDSWNEPYALNSSLLDAILVKLGLVRG